MALSGALMEYLPSMSVEVPVVEPLTITVAPISGSLFSSVTTPLTLTSVWACAATGKARHRRIIATNRASLLILSGVLVMIVIVDYFNA